MFNNIQPLTKDEFYSELFKNEVTKNILDEGIANFVKDGFELIKLLKD